MAQKPVIGLTTYGRKENGECRLPALYIDCVLRAGGIPVLIPPNAVDARELCGRLDGIILSGGGDIHPRFYNGTDHELIYNVDEERDEGELKVAEIIINQKIPTLAVCRGIQIMNVYLGGTLYEHIPDTHKEKILHRLPPGIACKHKVEIMPGTKLEQIMGQSEVEIVSWHHQSLKDIAREITITAKSNDGVIEGIEIDSHPWLVGIQWHPELSAEEDVLQQRLFGSLVTHIQKNNQTIFA